MPILSQKTYQSRLLSLLLDKYEQSQAFYSGEPGQRRPQFAFRQSELAEDYYDEMHYEKRELINTSLLELERREIVQVRWAKYRTGEVAERVYLNFPALDEAYALAGRQPKEDKLADLQLALQPLATHPWDWVRLWWQTTDRALGEKKSAGLNLDDLVLLQDLVRILSELPKHPDGILKRNLSQLALGGSKRLEQGAERLLLRILRQTAAEEYETDAQYLDSIGIIANPDLTLGAGPLQLALKDWGLIDLGILPGGFGLSGETIAVCRGARTGAKAVLTVENLTTYHGLVAALQSAGVSNILCIYTAGFPRRMTQQLLRLLGEGLHGTLPETPVLHWGDIDYGGIRIFEYLRSNLLPNLQPLLMNPATYHEHRASGLQFGDDYAAKLRGLKEQVRPDIWGETLDLLLVHRNRVEQESIDIREAVLLLTEL